MRRRRGAYLAAGKEASPAREPLATASPERRAHGAREVRDAWTALVCPMLLTFRTDRKNAEVVRRAGGTAVSLANSRSLDYGDEGSRIASTSGDRWRPRPKE